jgi:excisionase family DNA binding protein
MQNKPNNLSPRAEARLEAIERKLATLLERTATFGDRRFLKVSEAANYSGLSEESLRRLLAAGKLTSHRPVAGRVLVDRRQLDALILASHQLPQKRRGVYHRGKD